MEQNNNWIIDKKLASIIGIYPTILLYELEQKNKETKSEYFEYLSKDLENVLYMSSDLRRKYTDILLEKQLITIVKKGLPSRYYYKINYPIYKKYTNNGI